MTSLAAQSWSAATSFALAGAKLKRSIKPKDHLFDLESMKPEESILKLGDCISLFSIEGSGYISSEGFIDSDCNISPIGADKRIPDHFSDCVFKVVPRFKYDAQTALNEQLDTLNRTKASIGSRQFDSDAEVVAMEKKLLNLNKHEAEELNENQMEFSRLAGNSITYGQTVQLLHVKSNKFVTVTSKEIAIIETHCLRVYLDSQGNEGSWFTILPRFKTKAEGENVQFGDQIILESKRYNSLFLHVSKESSYLMREVNATTEKSSWRVIPFAPYVPEAETFLKAGDVLRLLHKEVEGYLTNEPPDDDFSGEGVEPDKNEAKKDEVYLQLISSSESKTKHESHNTALNSNALWQIELERPNRGGVILYETLYRFKHIATGYYLAAFPKRKKQDSQSASAPSPGTHIKKRATGISLGAASDDEDDEATECSLTTLKDFSSSATLFTIHPLGTYQDSDKRVKLDTYVRIKHQNTGCFIHADKESTERDKETPTRMKLMGREERFDEDAFGLLTAEQEEIDNLLRVVGQVGILKACATKLSQGEKLDLTKTGLSVSKNVQANDMRRVISVLRDLIISCTISSTGEEDVLIREGIPIPANQHLLREQHVIGVLMNLLQQTFSLNAINRRAYERPENYTLSEIAKYAYKLLKQILKKNPRNRTAMTKFVNYFQKRITFPPCTETLMELFRDNHNLLNTISDDQIIFFIFRLRNSGRVSSYIKFLSILCRCGEDPLPKNQNFICEKLIVENHDLLIAIKMDPDTGEVKVQISPREPWLHLEEFMNVPENKRQDDRQIYFIRTIKLFSNLCLGRNSYTSRKISRVMTYDLVLRCMMNPDLPFTLRASFCQLMQNLYVDVEPNKAVSLINYTRVWSDLNKKPMLNASTDASCKSARSNFSELCTFISYYVADNNVQSVVDVAHNKLTLSVVVLLKRMLELGFWMDTEESLRDLMRSLLALLDPSTDVSDGEPNPLYFKNDRTIWIMKTKYYICLILDMFFDLRLDHRLTELLIILNKQMDESTNELNLTNISKETEKKIDGTVMVWNHFLLGPDGDQEDTTKHSVAKNKDQDNSSTFLETILRYLVMCDYEQLSLASANLLVRHFSQRFELLSALQKVQILVTDKNVNAYQLVMNMKDELQQLLEKASVDGQYISKIIEQFTSLCQEDGKTCYHNQRILKNLDVHKLMIEILRLPFSKSLFTCAFSFLAAFCKDNAENQTALFEFLDLFLKMMGKDLYVAVTVNEMFNNNRPLCSQITEVQIRKIVSAIEADKKPRYMQLLMTLIIPNGIPLRRNQNLVMKMLLEKQQTTLVLFNDPESIEVRNKLIRERDYERPNSVLRFHMMEIELITKCSLGKIYEAEVRCQSLFSIGQIKRQLLDDINLRFIKKTFIKFLEEVYFLTQKPKNAVESDPELWRIYGEHFLKEIKLLANAFKSSNVQQHQFEEALDYVGTAVVPYLTNYFSKYFNKKDAFLHKAVSDQLLDALIELFYAAKYKAPQSVLMDVCALIDAMPRPDASTTASISA